MTRPQTINFETPPTLHIDDSEIDIILRGTAAFDVRTGPKANVEAWNGKFLYSERLALDSEPARLKYAKTLSAIVPTLPVAHIRGVLVTLAAQVHQEAERRAQYDQDRGDQHQPYVIENGKICSVRGDAVEPLCNFVATIASERVVDDGASERGELEIVGTLDTGQPLGTAIVSYAQYPRMEWVMASWGSRARVKAGIGAKDMLREGIQLLSTDVRRTIVYGHTGWRNIDGTWRYLHADGAVSPESVPRNPGAEPFQGTESGGYAGDPPLVDSDPSPMSSKTPEIPVTVHLGGNMQHYRLPAVPQGTHLQDAIRESLGVLGVAPLPITTPLLAAVYRAPLIEALSVDVSLYLVGQSGTFKSELTALAQAHHGGGFTRLSLPASWVDTANAIERYCFEAKDAVLVIDDFAPKGSPQDVAKQHAMADRVFRGAGNRAGRNRMHADGTLRPSYPPRCFILSSGEDIPQGQSVVARLVVVEVSPGDVQPDRLRHAQQQARSGRYAAAMAGYVAWLAPQMDALRTLLPARLETLRGQIYQQAMHRRTPDAVANLLIGWELWLRFAVESGAIGDAEGAEIWGKVQVALITSGQGQAGHTASKAPARQFIDLIAAALAAQRAHLTELDGSQPGDPQRWGWRSVERERWDEEARCKIRESEWTIAPGSRHIGYLKNEQEVYLLPDAAYGMAQQLAGEKRESVNVGERVLWKRLHEGRLLASVDEVAGKYVVRRRVGPEARVYVLHILGTHLAGISGDSGDIEASGEPTRESTPPVSPDLVPRKLDSRQFRGTDSGDTAGEAPAANFGPGGDEDF